MKFLFTVASYYPIIGGVQVVTQNTAEELVKQGNEVTVLISRNRGIKELNELNGVKLKYYDLYTKKDKIVGNKEEYVSYLKDLCKDFDVLVNVSVHSALTDAILPHIQEFKCKTVLYLHGIYEFKWSEKDKSSPTRILSKLYYNSRRRLFYSKLYKYAKNYDLIVHLSEEDISMKYMKKYGISQNTVIHNAAERAFFEPPVSECDEKYFLQVANYAEHKNQEYSLRAFYKSDCRDVKMVYVGSQKNSYYEYLVDLNSKLAQEYGERKVEFQVGISRSDTIEMFKHASAIILSSRVEKFPMVLVEGLACGVPFISTDCGCVGTLQGGCVVHSIEEMAECMSYYHSHTFELNQRKNERIEYAIHNMTVHSKVQSLLDSIGKVSEYESDNRT